MSVVSWTSRIAIAAAVLLAITVTILLHGGLGGLGQRAIFLLLYAWVWLVGHRIQRMVES